MIEDMASLKQAMEQMDAQDPAVADAARTRAAQILSNSKLSFAKMAELIEQRRLLLRPKILANIKRMDQPVLGDAAFHDVGAALRREGQSFHQIAEAIELNGGTAPLHEEPLQMTAALHPLEVEDSLEPPPWLAALALAARIVFFPVRHPLRFFTVALLVFVLFNAVRGLVGFGQQVSGFVDGVAGARQQADRITSAISSFFGKPVTPPSREAATSPTSPSPIPSPSVAAVSPIPSATPTTASAAPSSMPAPAPSPSAAGTPVPLAPAPRLDARESPSRAAANDRPRTVRRALEDLMPAGPRRSRQAEPCIGGVGGCYWGGGRY